MIVFVATLSPKNCKVLENPWQSQGSPAEHRAPSAGSVTDSSHTNQLFIRRLAEMLKGPSGFGQTAGASAGSQRRSGSGAGTACTMLEVQLGEHLALDYLAGNGWGWEPG